MTEENRNILINAGMDLDEALERFMNNEALLEKLLKKFLVEPSYEQLKEAVAGGDVEQAFTASHTLKGVAANFSFNSLKSTVSDQCEEFRAKKMSEGAQYMDEITLQYNKLIEAIKAVYNEA